LKRGSSTTLLALGLPLTVIGASTFNILPLLTAAAADTLGFSERQAGFMSSAICIGSGVSSLVAGIWVRSVNWRRAALVSLGGMVAANGLSMMLHGYWAFVLMQGAAGFFAGATFCLAITAISDVQEPARSFGISSAMQVSYQVAALLAGPALLRWAGLNGVLVMLAVPAALAMLFAPLLPVQGRTVLEPDAKALLRPATLVALLGFGAFFVNAGAFWTYVELIGLARGMSARVVANCVAAGVSAGMLGGGLASVLGERFGRLRPILVATALTVGAVLLLNGSFGAAAFVVAGMLYFFAWNYSYSYQLAMINEVDATGRGVAITQVFGFLGIAGGAAFAALFVTPGDYHAVTWVAIGAVCLSTALYALSSSMHRHADARGGTPIPVRSD